ncbi:hypothetical protein [Ralstonia syzygii]|uniref:Uncharacterized protein n=1 Tax=Ralstonia syzygii R24 TaxID=907261 RepID=G3A0U2_9RALS|nr:hypothetical protein [Ralstonia syzygii]CCA84807.1 conserved hypothetical protein [Ralstonia syzygii R24]
MTNKHCPTCRGLTAADGTVIRSDGKQETLYRCNAHGCCTVFSHTLSLSNTPDKRIQTYREAPSSQDVIRTDC